MFLALLQVQRGSNTSSITAHRLSSLFNYWNNSICLRATCLLYLFACTCLLSSESSRPNEVKLNKIQVIFFSFKHFWAWTILEKDGCWASFGLATQKHQSRMRFNQLSFLLMAPLNSVPTKTAQYVFKSTRQYIKFVNINNIKLLHAY